VPFGRHTSAHAYQYDQGDDIYIGPNDEIDPDGGTIEMLKFTRVVFKCGIPRVGGEPDRVAVRRHRLRLARRWARPVRNSGSAEPTSCGGVAS